jgi:hypothetical protein
MRTAAVARLRVDTELTQAIVSTVHDAAHGAAQHRVSKPTLPVGTLNAKQVLPVPAV